MMKKKKLAVLLLVLFICNLAFAGIVMAEDTAGTAAEPPATEEKSMAEIAEENKYPVVDTGSNPLWKIESLEVIDEDNIKIGENFEVEITARNIGTGTALAPIIEFKEYRGDDKETLSHFEVVGGEGDVYQSNIQRVESGEAKVFTVTLKVKDTTPEAAAEDGYKLTAVLKSKNWNVNQPAAFAVSKDFYVKPLYALSNPTFVVKTVTFSPEVTSGVKNTVATITIDNISDRKARNVTVALAGKAISEKNTDKNIVIKDLSNTKRVGDIDGKQTFSVSYEMELNSSRKDNEVTMTINYDGAEEATEEILNLPLPLDNTGDVGKTPRVIINKYNVLPSKAYAGSQVTLALYIENTNDKPVTNVQISLKVPQNEGSSNNSVVSSGTVFSPIDSSNTFFIERIDGKTVAEKTVNMYVDPNATAKTYVVPVEIQYEDIDGNVLTSEDNVNIPVGQESKIDIITSNVTPYGNVGTPVDYNIEFVNSGKVAVGNFKAFLEGEIPDVENQVYYVGSFDVGATDTFSGIFIPDTEGTLTGNVVFTYIDADNQEVRMEQPFSVEVGPMPEMPDMGDMPMPEEPQESTIQKIKDNAVTIVLVVIIIILAIALIRIKRKAKADEELFNG